MISVVNGFINAIPGSTRQLSSVLNGAGIWTIKPMDEFFSSISLSQDPLGKLMMETSTLKHIPKVSCPSLGYKVIVFLSNSNWTLT